MIVRLARAALQDPTVRALALEFQDRATRCLAELARLRATMCGDSLCPRQRTPPGPGKNESRATGKEMCTHKVLLPGAVYCTGDGRCVCGGAGCPDACPDCGLLEPGPGGSLDREAFRRWLAGQPATATFSPGDMDACPLARYLQARGMPASVWPDCLTVRPTPWSPLEERPLPLWAAVYVRLVDRRRAPLSSAMAQTLLGRAERWLRSTPRDLPLPATAFRALLADRPEGCAGAFPAGRAAFARLLRQILEGRGLTVAWVGWLGCVLRCPDGRRRRFSLPVWARALGLFWETEARRQRLIPAALARAWLDRVTDGVSS